MKMDKTIREAPKCARCGKPAILLYNDFWLCGKCYLEIYNDVKNYMEAYIKNGRENMPEM